MPRCENRFDGKRNNSRCGTFLRGITERLPNGEEVGEKIFYAKLQSPLIFIKIPNSLYKISIKNKATERTNLIMPIYEFINIV